MSDTVLPGVGVSLPGIGVSLVSGTVNLNYAGESLFGIQVSLVTAVITPIVPGTPQLAFNQSTASVFVALFAGTI